MSRVAVLVCLVAICGLCGCGYTAGGPFQSGIKTIHVEMFGSREFRRDLEFQLTEAVKKRIGLDTPYRLAPLNHADTVLSGQILEARQAAWAPDPYTRYPREKQLTLGVRVRWKDLRSGRMLFDKPVLLQAADYLTASGETEQYTHQRVIEKMSERIVSEMYDQW